MWRTGIGIPPVVSNKKNPVQADYKLHGHTLARVKSAKYLGVWQGKQDNRFPETKSEHWSHSHQREGVFHSSSVRPLAEYASTVWDPHTQSNKYNTNTIQVQILYLLIKAPIMSRIINTMKINTMVTLTLKLIGYKKWLYATNIDINTIQWQHQEAGDGTAAVRKICAEPA